LVTLLSVVAGVVFACVRARSNTHPLPSGSQRPVVAGLKTEGTIIRGRVVGVADGDTVTVLDDANTPHKIRLLGIDAPERAMPFGQRSKQFLSSLVFQKQVDVEVRSKDRYGREVGRILVDGQDVNLAQVQGGLSWVYRQYLKELTENEARNYLEAEESAKANKRGLWSEENPTPPWEWRKARKKGKNPMVKHEDDAS
jgi:endonuclease YncB( thermonuclease family)